MRTRRISSKYDLPCVGVAFIAVFVPAWHHFEGFSRHAALPFSGCWASVCGISAQKRRKKTQ